VRIAFLPDGDSANAAYRSIGPMDALAARGHQVHRLDLARIDAWPDALRWCEVLHVHRVCDSGAVELARAAKQAGAAVVWDDDDDVTRPPRGVTGKGIARRREGARRLAARGRLFEAVDLVTTPSEVLAELFREGGAAEVQVIENYVIDRLLGGRLPRDPVRIGWVAGDEHQLDLQHVPLTSALERLLDAHPNVHVTTIGVRLDLASDRYSHVRVVPFAELLSRVSAFDVGIAPLSPSVGINHARSNIKLKEYAAVGVPWLASPIGPYAGLGERQGGRLVPDDRWYEALDALVCSDRARRKLAKRAARWGREQLLSRNLARWEQALAHAVERSRVRV
jgi:glycosyltransferase involved in cell wall biosynthesis